MDYERIVRRLRADPRLFTEEDGHKIHRVLRKAIRLYVSKRERTEVRQVGTYSGLTRAELGRTGTCETDWF